MNKTNDNLFQIVNFCYNDKNRKVFITESNETLFAGYEMNDNDPRLNDYSGLQKAYLLCLQEAFNSKDEKWIKILTSNLKEVSNWSFKKFLKQKVQK